MNYAVKRRLRLSKGEACRTFLAPLLTIFATIGAASESAPAQTAFTLPAPPFELPLVPSVSGNWTAMIGVGGEYKPDFEGANRSVFSPVPIFSIRLAGSTEQFRGPRDSASIALIDFGDLRAGPAGKFVAARNANSYSELNGLGDVKAAFELGGFVEYYPVDWFRARVELRQGVVGHHGTVADFSGDFIVPVFQRLTFSAGPRFTWESTQATSPYFGVDAVQAMTSGLPAFNARGGAHSYGAGAQVSYRFNPQWEVHSYVEYERLLGDAANSPLVTARGSPNQTTVGIGASYSFDFKIHKNAMHFSSRCASFATVALLVLGVGACATFETGETKLRAIKTVGIISAVGDQMSFASIGLTGLTNPVQSFPIGSWGLDDMIVQQATAALHGRFEVQPVNYNRAAFAAVKDSPVAPVNLIRGDPFKKLVQTAVSPQGLDAYIVITKARSNFGSGGRKVEGIGFITYGTLLASYNQIHVLYEIRVFDGKTFDVIEKMAALPLDNAETIRLTGPSRIIDENFSASSGDPARNEKLHGAITDLIARSLPSTLSDMHLADVL